MGFSEVDVSREPHVKLTEATEPTAEATLVEPSREGTRVSKVPEKRSRAESEGTFYADRPARTSLRS